MTSGGVRLLEGTSQIQHVPVDVGCPLVAATLADPYLSVLAEDGTLMVFTLVTSRTLPPKLTTTKPYNPDVSINFICCTVVMCQMVLLICDISIN